MALDSRLLRFGARSATGAGPAVGEGVHEAEATLMLRVVGGDSAAFARLYDAHSRPVFGLLARMLGAGGEAEEVLQETFLQAWRQAERFRDGSSIRAWLLTIARSRALDRIRSQRSSRRRDAAVQLEVGEAQPATAATAVEEHELAQGVRQALSSLGAEQRQCVELAFFEGLTHTQIAERLGAPLGTVKSRILLGMRKLRESLAPYR